MNYCLHWHSFLHSLRAAGSFHLRVCRFKCLDFLFDDFVLTSFFIHHLIYCFELDINLFLKT